MKTNWHDFQEGVSCTWLYDPDRTSRVTSLAFYTHQYAAREWFPLFTQTHTHASVWWVKWVFTPVNSRYYIYIVCSWCQLYPMWTNTLPVSLNTGSNTIHLWSVIEKNGAFEKKILYCIVFQYHLWEEKYRWTWIWYPMLT